MYIFPTGLSMQMWALCAHLSLTSSEAMGASNKNTQVAKLIPSVYWSLFSTEDGGRELSAAELILSCPYIVFRETTVTRTVARRGIDREPHGH